MDLYAEILSTLKGDVRMKKPNYIVKIYADERYHLYLEGANQPCRFTKIMDYSEDMDHRFPLQKQFDGVWEDVGDISLREILLMPVNENPIYLSLKQRNKNYTVLEFVDRKQYYLKGG